MPPARTNRPAENCFDEAIGSAYIEMVPRARLLQCLAQIERHRSGCVVEIKARPLREWRSTDPVQKCRPRTASCAVMQLERSRRSGQMLGHAQDRRNADPAGPQHDARRRRIERELVARLADTDKGARLDGIDQGGASTRGGLAQ